MPEPIITSGKTQFAPLSERHAPGTDPGEPIPYTLTAKARAALGCPAPEPVMHCGCGYADCTACAGYGWACIRCGAAFFGAAPETGKCPACDTGSAA